MRTLGFQMINEGLILTRAGYRISLGAGVGEVLDQNADFGALTLASEGGFKPYNTNNETVDLLSVDDQTGATRTWSIDGNGALVANGTPDLDDGVQITCSHSGGSVVLTVNVIANAYSVADLTELTSFVNLSAANKSGKTCYLRGGSYATTSGLFDGKHESLTDWVTYRSHSTTDMAVLQQFAIVNTTATGNTQGYVRLKDLDFYLSVGTESKLTGNFSSTSSIVDVANQNPVQFLEVLDCNFSSDAPISRITGLRPATRVTCINTRRGDSITISGCTCEYVTSLASLVSSNVLVENCTGRYLWDDPVRLVTESGTTPSGVVRNNTFYDFIGDHGYHPDGIHMFSSGGTNIDGVDFYGNLIFPGYEGMIAPAWPVSVDGGSYIRDASLTTSNFSLSDADHERFIFIDGRAADYTVTLTDPSLAAGNRDMLLQSWFTPQNQITIDSNGFTLYDFDNDTNITSWDMIEPWETIQLRIDQSGARWTLHRYGPTYQGVFSNSPTNGVDNVSIYDNIIWFNANSVTQDGVNSENWDVWNNSFIPCWPGDITGTGRSNTKSQYSGFGGNRFINFDGSVANIVGGNIASSVSGETGTAEGDTVANVLSGELDLNNTWADVAGAFTVSNPAVQQHYPTTPAEAISMARPKSSGSLDGLGMGAGLSSDSANDYYNFGQFSLESRGFRSTAPWFVRRPTVVAGPGGFSSQWYEPHTINGAITAYNVEYSVNGGAYSNLAGVGTNTSASYSGASEGDSIVVRIRAVNANGNGPWHTANAVIAIAPPTTPSLSALDNTTFSGGGSGASSNQYESGIFTPAGDKPILLLLHLRSSADIDQPTISCTIGTSGRTYGTGTSLTQIHRARSQRANTYAFWLASPAASSQTIQVEFTGAGNGLEMRTFEVSDTSTYGAFGNATGNSTTNAPSVTTTEYGSLVVSAVTILNNSVVSSTQTEIYDVQPNVATSASAATEDAAATGTYTNTFSWTGTTFASGIAVEIKPS